jgi:L-fucose isomerase-like protein
MQRPSATARKMTGAIITPAGDAPRRPEASWARRPSITEAAAMTAVDYAFPSVPEAPPAAPDEVVLISSGDLRNTANQVGWPAQQVLEGQLTSAFAAEGLRLRRLPEPDAALGHGFIWNQRMGMQVFERIHPDARLVVAEAVWQYTHHVFAGLRTHRGPILTAANWSGQWPGLVGMLNLNASLTKAGVPYSTIWSEDFATDERARRAIHEWVTTTSITHDTSHVRDLDLATLPAREVELGQALAADLQRRKAILGVFDEGCMGMYNAIIDDELLNPLGLYKERLSQSALYARMRTVPDAEAEAVLEWLTGRGMRFLFGLDEATELTRAQVIEQLKMYIAALRIADDFGCTAIGIQYQQGLKDLVPASDLAEGLLNDRDRPPVRHERTGRVLYDGAPLPHFNEVDEGCAVDAVITNKVWTAMGLDPSTTLHDVRWGDPYGARYVWVFEISGSVPPSHLAGGYAGAVSERQAPMYFALGGGTIKGVSKPGEVVWSRVFIMDGGLHVDIGRATAIELPREETERRWQATSPQWPIMHAVLHGVTRDQFMARHRANHIQVVYAPDAATADRALAAKAAMFDALGVRVHLCGSVLGGTPAA